MILIKNFNVITIRIFFSTFLFLCTVAIGAVDLKPFSGSTPPLVLEKTDGSTVDLNDLEGKVTLVQFWATYCTACRVEMPSMNRLRAMMGDRLEILAVNMGETTEEVQVFIDEVKPEFTVLMDRDGTAIRAWKVFAAPASFIVDPSGQIRYTLFGATEWDADDMVETLNALL